MIYDGIQVEIMNKMALELEDKRMRALRKRAAYMRKMARMEERDLFDSASGVRARYF